MSISSTNMYFASYWLCKNGHARNVRPQINEELNDKSKIWKLKEISDPSQCRSLKLLGVTKATTSVSPVQWQPSSGILMTNDVQEPNHEEAVSCFTLSKNDCYVIPTSGGKILFNMMTFKRVRTFMPPPPAATYIAFHPQDNNIIAIGMDNSTIQIYNVRLDEVKSKLKGHSQRITGLAFSHLLNVLVSSGADSQLCMEHCWAGNAEG
ncbi:hypothetical protein RDI58_009037 [Solanum bulbocastanum]|uniref:Uncharacterized protein n=1 Tax=Solanum bulbocastanum TaxID=147425 RepID=A0AAN8YNR2_SOLBU